MLCKRFVCSEVLAGVVNGAAGSPSAPMKALKAVSEISGNVDLQICLPTMKSSLHNTISGLFYVPQTWLSLFMRVDMGDVTYLHFVIPVFG
jgi:hypothetical protein